jgi:maltooligosyltrehalose trehalohydrolase
VLRPPFHHDGQYSSFRRKRFGAPAGDRPVEQFVVFSANHDQVGNRAFGDRLPTRSGPSPPSRRFWQPFTPMIFMGDEYGECAPFQFFSDHIDEEIAVATREGRRREFAAFAQFAGEQVPNPQALETFADSTLTRVESQGLRDLHRELLRERRRLGAAPVATRADEEASTLVVDRGNAELAMNFSREERRVEVERRVVAVATHEARFEDGAVVLAPLAGALLK